MKFPLLAKAEQASTDWGTAMGVTGTDAAALTKLRALKVDDILKRRAMEKTEGGSTPFLDGKVITDQVSVLFAKGEIAKVPYIAGSNSNEASLATAIGSDPVKDLSKFGDALPKVRAIYETDGKLTDEEFGRQAFGDALSSQLPRRTSRALSPRRANPRASITSLISPIISKAKCRALITAARFLSSSDSAGWAFSPTSRVTRIEKPLRRWAITGSTSRRPATRMARAFPHGPRFSDASRDTLVVGDTIKAVADFRRGQVGVMTAAWAKRVGLSAP